MLMLVIACQFKMCDILSVPKQNLDVHQKHAPRFHSYCSYGHRSPFGVRLQCKKACFKYCLRSILKAAREAQRILAGKQSLNLLLEVLQAKRVF